MIVTDRVHSIAVTDRVAELLIARNYPAVIDNPVDARDYPFRDAIRRVRRIEMFTRLVIDPVTRKTKRVLSAYVMP